MLKLQEALQQMQLTNAKGHPKPFSITYCTADVSRKTGGEIIHQPQAVLARLRKAVQKKGLRRPAPTKIHYHKENRTRNICALGSSEVRKVHIDLILQFNGEAIA